MILRLGPRGGGGSPPEGKEQFVRRLWPAMRLSAGLVSLCLSVMFIAGAMGLIPDRFGAIMAGRKAFCESLAVHCSLAAQKNDLSLAKAALNAAVERNGDILSAA